MDKEVKEVKATRNPVNVELADKIVKRMVNRVKQIEGSEHISKWLQSTFRRWIQNESPFFKPVMDKAIANSPWLKITQSILTAAKIEVNIKDVVNAEYEFIDVSEYPDWVKEALARNDDLIILQDFNEEAQIKYDHWVDYCMTLPDRSINMTYQQMESAVRAWDKAAQKAEIVGSLVDGVLMIETTAFDDLDEPIYLVSLETKEAYENESVVMSNCVRNYFKRRGKGTRVYSLRKHGQDQSLLSIEVTNDNVCQVQGYSHRSAGRSVSVAVGAALKTWAAEAGFSWFRAKPVVRNGRAEYPENPGRDDYDDDDEEDDEDDYEEEDDEDADGAW